MEGTRFRHFEIKGLLGRGGMGEVYLAIDHTLERQVALKFLPRDLMGDASAQGRLLDEARSCSRIQHPNIAIIHSIEEDGGVHALVMEYVQGRTLREVLAKQQLNLSRVVRVGRAIAAGLIAAHEQGVIHRDLKPANVMLTNRGELKIMDFGLALRPERIVQTVGNKAYGTVNYMSPEQARGETPTVASDIFSYGTLLYELLTGECPFRGENDLAVLQAIIHDEPTSLRTLRRDTPPALEALIRRCMQKHPGHRYGSMHEVAAELQYAEPEVENGPKNLISELATGLNGEASGGPAAASNRPRQRELGDDPGDGLPRMAPELNVPISDVLDALDHSFAQPKDTRPSGFIFPPDLKSRKKTDPKLIDGIIFDSRSTRFDPATQRRAEEVAREMPRPTTRGSAGGQEDRTARGSPTNRSRQKSRPDSRRSTNRGTAGRGSRDKRHVFLGVEPDSMGSASRVSPSISAPPKQNPWKNIIGLVIALLIAIAGFLGLLHAAGVRKIPGQQLIEQTRPGGEERKTGNAALEKSAVSGPAAVIGLAREAVGRLASTHGDSANGPTSPGDSTAVPPTNSPE